MSWCKTELHSLTPNRRVVYKKERKKKDLYGVDRNLCVSWSWWDTGLLKRQEGQKFKKRKRKVYVRDCKTLQVCECCPFSVDSGFKSHSAPVCMYAWRTGFGRWV